MTSIRSLPKEDRPREKLLKKGSKALTDAELLAIFLRIGIKGKNAIQLAREIIDYFGNLKSLFSADINHFCQIKGLGVAKYVQLQACLEMSQRYLLEDVKIGGAMNSVNQVKSYIHSCLVGHSNEVFAVLFLDNQHRILAFEELFYGSINSTTVHPRVIIQRALSLNAAAVILAHNHPSGSAKASISDI
jgi:DNA repair protein RadC